MIKPGSVPSMARRAYCTKYTKCIETRRGKIQCQPKINQKTRPIQNLSLKCPAHTASFQYQVLLKWRESTSDDGKKPMPCKLRCLSFISFLERITHRKGLRGKTDAIGRAITDLESLMVPWPTERTSYQQPPSGEAHSDEAT